MHATRALLFLSLLTPAAALAGSKGSAAQVDLVEKGAKPRVLLDYTPAVGTSQTVRVTMGLGLSMDMMGMAVPIEVPTTWFDMKTVVLEDTPDGLRCQTTVTDVGVLEGNADPAMVEGMRAELAPLAGLEGTYLIGPQGMAESLSFDIPEGLGAESTAQLQKSMASGVPVLPPKKVGVGAVWTVTQQLDDQGFTMDQVTTFTLQALEGRVATLGVEITQSAEPQPVVTADMPEGATSTLDSLEGAGTGGMVVDLDQPLPKRSQVDLKADFVMTTKVEGMSMPIRSSMEVGILMETLPDSP